MPQLVHGRRRSPRKWHHPQTTLPSPRQVAHSSRRAPPKSPQITFGSVCRRPAPRFRCNLCHHTDDRYVGGVIPHLQCHDDRRMNFPTQTCLAAIGFPVVILLLVPLRTLVIPRLPFTPEELTILDGPTASPFVSRFFCIYTSRV